MMEDNEDFFKSHMMEPLCQGDNNDEALKGNDAQKNQESEIIITRHRNAINEQGHLKTIDFDILSTLQFTYVFPYFFLTFMSFVFIYCFSEDIAFMWTVRCECFECTIDWFLGFIVFCPIAAITAVTCLRRVYESLQMHQYPLYTRGYLVKHLSCTKKSFLAVYSSIDLFNIAWAVYGLVHGSHFRPHRQEHEDGYVIFIAGLLIGFGFLCVLRLAYLLTTFLFGQKIFTNLANQEEKNSEVRIKFQCCEFTPKLAANLLDGDIDSKFTTMESMSLHDD